jgi:putative addiction module CopG family antidote
MASRASEEVEIMHHVDGQVKNGRYLDASDVVREALRWMEAQTNSPSVLNGGQGDGDIMALVSAVLMEAAKSAREDLRSIMESVKAINSEKRGLRKLLVKINRDVTANAGCEGVLDFSKGLGSERPQFTNLCSISKRWECSKRVLGGTGC